MLFSLSCKLILVNNVQISIFILFFIFSAYFSEGMDSIICDSFVVFFI